MRRAWVVTALVVAASVTLALAVVATYARVVYVDSSQFANRASDALRDDAVRTLIAERVTEDIVLDQQQDLLAAKPVIEGVVSGVVGSRAFTDLFRAGVRDAHRALVHGDTDTVTLTVADVGSVVAAALDVLKPSVAAKVRRTGGATVVDDKLGEVGEQLSAIARRAELLSVVLVLLFVALAFAAVMTSRERHRTLASLGVGAAVAGVLLVIVWQVGRTIVLGQVEGTDERPAAGAVWDAFLVGLRTLAWLVAGLGAVVAASAAAVIRPEGVPVRAIAARLVREPKRPLARAARGVALMAAGIVVVLDPSAALQAVATAAGVLLVYTGSVALLRLAAPDAPLERRPRRHHRTLAAVGALALVAIVVAGLAGTHAVTTAAPRGDTCNGHRELCGRPLHDVALAATHNSMSVPLPGWYSAEQERPIADQLRDGIRGLLIDTHYGDKLANGRVRTAASSLEDLKANARADGVSEDAIKAALRIRERLGFSGEGERGMYLCHSFCELGATPLGDVLHQLHDFLVANPGEVVVVINQDAVTPQDFVAAADEAGLGEFGYAGPLGGDKAATLGEMVRTDKRLVVMAEEHGGAAPWYRRGYAADLQDTPYTFPTAEALAAPASCDDNRGPASAPLFLVNHWVSTDPLPKPSTAARVNAYGPLLRRVEECRRRRGQLPNLIAVNFYRRGALERVVDELNGFGSSTRGSDP